MRSRIYRFRYALVIAPVTIAIALVLAAATLISGPAVMQDGGYADAAGRFTAPIPDGWTNASTDDHAQYTKGDATVYIVTIENAADIQAGVDAALKIIAPDFDRTQASIIDTGGDAVGPNGSWKEHVYQEAGGRIYYTDSQLKQGTAYIVITTAPNMVALMKIANDARGVIIGIDFAGEEEVPVVTPTSNATPIPVYETPVTLPAPTGAYQVGRRVFTWTDASRPEIYSADPDDHRLLTVWAWYPADECTQPAPYLPDAMVAAMKTMLSVDALKVTGHACADAALSAKQAAYPVLLFSHGNMSNALFSSAMMEDLASHGYIIFGIDHTYDALLTTLPDGQVIRALAEATPETAETLAMRVADIRFTLDEIAALNAGSDALAGHLNMAQVGLIGHSFGGAASAEACREDARCQSVVVIDVPLRGDVAAQGLTQPALLMDSERISPEQYITEAEALTGQAVPVGLKEYLEAMNQDRDAAAAAVMNASSAGTHLRINGTRHNSFTDVAFLIAQQPALQANLGGITGIDGTRAWRISDDYLLAFFGQTLRGETSALLDGPDAAYPEIVFVN